MDLQGYHKIFADGWQLFKSYYPPKKEQKYWDNLIFDASNMAELNNRRDFAIKMATIIVNELERIERKEESK